MDFLKPSKRRSLLSEVIYVALNIALAVALLLVVLATESILPAIGIFLLSKWRIFAVRPRYWFANIQTNLVDSIVGISFVVLLYSGTTALPVQIVLTLLYIGWLIFLKPRSKRAYVAVQAGVSVFFGVTALMMISYAWPSSAVVLSMWLIGFSSARHVLGSYEEPHRSFYSLTWGLVFAEIGWLAYHWTFAYTIPGLAEIKLTQAAIISIAISFLAERVYASYKHHDTVRSGDILLPGLLSVSVIVIIMVLFNTIEQGAI